jgi:hypothetical protein
MKRAQQISLITGGFAAHDKPYKHTEHEDRGGGSPNLSHPCSAGGRAYGCGESNGITWDTGDGGFLHAFNGQNQESGRACGRGSWAGDSGLC